MKFECPENGSVLIKFETDAEDKYFTPYVGRGKLKVSHPSIMKKFRLNSGIGKMWIQPSMSENTKYKAGDNIEFKVALLEKSIEKFREEFDVTITPPLVKSESEKFSERKKLEKKRKKPHSFGRFKKPIEGDEGEGKINLPKLTGISKESTPDKWAKYFDNEYQGAVFKRSGDKFNAWINLSNPSLMHYVKIHQKNMRPAKIQEAYTQLVGYVPFALHMLNESNQRKYEEENINVLDLMNAASDSIALWGIDFAFSFKDIRKKR